MVKGVEVMSHWTGLDVYLPDGRKLGIVHDAVIDAESLHCTHLFVRGTPSTSWKAPSPSPCRGAGFEPSTTSCSCVGFPHAHSDSVLR